CQVKALDPSFAVPLLKLVAVMEIVRAGALAEQDPVAMMARLDPLAQQRPQSGQTGAVADQHQGPVVRGAMEGRVATYPQVDPPAWLGVSRQPAAADAKGVVGVRDLSHQQPQLAFRGDGSDRVGAVGEWLQPVSDGLGHVAVADRFG